MRKKSNLVINASIALLISILLSGKALGCSCGSKTIDDRIYAISERIIVGEIIEAKKDKVNGLAMLSLKIKVDKVWKQKTEQTVWLPLLDIKDMCGDMPIVLGKKYFFRTMKFRDGAAVIGDCGISRLLEYAADDLKYLSGKHAWSYPEEKR